MDELNLRQLIKPLLKWWWLIAASLLLAGVSSGLYTLRQPSTYMSRTTIMVGSSLLEPNPNSSDLFLASQLASAYVDIVQRSTVRIATQEALGLSRLPYYTARLVPNTQLIEVSVVDIDPTRAQAVAGELIRQLLRIGPSTQDTPDTPEHQAFIEDQLTEMEEGIKQTTAEIERIKAELTGMFSARQIRDAREQITALESKLSTLQANYGSLIANSRRGATNTIHLLEPAN
jgi:succinoglycan biosynthesis transport protein ExoP